jgi:hypothetical protein
MAERTELQGQRGGGGCFLGRQRQKASRLGRPARSELQQEAELGGRKVWKAGKGLNGTWEQELRREKDKQGASKSEKGPQKPRGLRGSSRFCDKAGA